MKLAHRLLRLDLGGHGAGQGVEHRLPDGRRQACGTTGCGQGVREAAKTTDGLVLPYFGGSQDLMQAHGDSRSLFGAFHGDFLR